MNVIEIQQHYELAMAYAYVIHTLTIIMNHNLKKKKNKKISGSLHADPYHVLVLARPLTAVPSLTVDSTALTRESPITMA
jgi:hypothetical protein